MKKTVLAVIFTLFSMSSSSQMEKERNVLYVTIDNFGGEFEIGMYDKKIYPYSINEIWSNQPHKFFEQNDRSELETKIHLENTPEGQTELKRFKEIRSVLKTQNSYLIVPLRLLNPSFDVETNEMVLLKTEDIEFLFPEFFQFEEVVLTKPKNIRITNKKITNSVSWNYYRIPMSDLNKALAIEKNYKNLYLKIEFKITAVSKIPHTFSRQKIEGNAVNIKIVDSDFNTEIWTYQ